KLRWADSNQPSRKIAADRRGPLHPPPPLPPAVAEQAQRPEAQQGQGGGLGGGGGGAQWRREGACATKAGKRQGALIGGEVRAGSSILRTSYRPDGGRQIVGLKCGINSRR